MHQGWSVYSHGHLLFAASSHLDTVIWGFFTKELPHPVKKMLNAVFFPRVSEKAGFLHLKTATHDIVNTEKDTRLQWCLIMSQQQQQQQ